MNCEVTQAQIDSYQENGFVVFDDFLTPDELEIWRDAVDQAVGNRKDQKLVVEDADEDDDRWKAGDSYYDYVFVQRINLWKDSPAVRKLILDPRIGRMAALLSGTEGMRVWHDQALIKQPWANPTAWHLDNPYWSFHSRKSTSIWVALDDATYQNGCLYFLGGSHKQTTYDNVGITENMADIFRVYPDFVNMPSMAAPMKAGSCSFHNALLVHGAGANMTGGWRRAMTCGFMPYGSTFNGNQNILSDEQFASYEIGDVIDDDNQNPVVWHRNPELITAKP
jgi:ectoine hydroxylase-related dioxygenase (phytanoyl-CoA dioxygenase family)